MVQLLLFTHSLLEMDKFEFESWSIRGECAGGAFYYRRHCQVKMINIVWKTANIKHVHIRQQVYRPVPNIYIHGTCAPTKCGV